MSVPTVEAVTNSVTTAEEALAVISDLRARFDLVGTEFTPEDVTSHVSTMLSEAPADVAEFMTPHIARAVTSDSRWSRLRDTLAEHGNEVLGDVVVETCGLFASLPFGPEHALLVTSRDGEGEVVREATLLAVDALPFEVEAGKSNGAVSISVSTAYRAGGDIMHRDYSDAITVWTD